MALTKVTGGILSQPIDLGITTATTGFFSGIVTAQSVRVLGDLTVDGSTTTLDTVVTEVDRLEVGANNVTVGVAITQSGTGDILRLYDSSTSVFTVRNGGNIGIGTDAPKQTLEVFSGSAGRPTFRHTGGFGGLQIAGPQPGSGASLMFTRSYDVVGGGLTAYSLLMAGNTQGLHFISGDPSEASTKTRLFLNSSGNVGINTSNPRQKFHLDNGSMFIRGDTAPSIRINAAINDTSSTRLMLGLATGANNFFNGAAALDACLAAPTNGRLLLGVGVAARMYIVNSGDVTIGRGTQLGNAKLSIQSDAAQETIAIQLNQNSGITTALSLYNSAGPEIFNFSINSDNTPDVIFKLRDSSATLKEKLRIDSNGRVGIGTNNPGSKLHISGDGAGQNTLRIDTSTTAISFNNYSEFMGYMGNDSGVLYINAVGTERTLSLRTQYHERLVIASDGKIGIGTVSPETTLDVYGDNTSSGGLIQITQDGTGDAAIDFQLKGTREYSLGIDNSDSDKFKLSGSAGLANNTLLTVTNSGNLGIGTDNPTKKLQVMGTILKTRSDSGIGLIYLQHDSSQNGQIVVNQKDGVTRVLLHTDGASYFNGGDVIVNDTTADGNVHPDTKFHVKGGISFRELTSATEGALPAITQWSNNGTSQDLAIGTRSSSGSVIFFTGNSGTDGDWNGSSNAERLRIASDGAVYVNQQMAFQQSDGATTAGLLGRGSLLLAGTQQTDFAIRSAPHNSNLVLGVGVTERLRIDSDGKLGIGTDNPSALVHIEATEPFLRLENTHSGSKRLDLRVEEDDNHAYISAPQSAQHLKLYGRSAFTIATNSETSERLRINSDGQVVINRAAGAVRAASASKLEVFNDTYNTIFVSNSTAATDQEVGIMFAPANNTYGGQIVVKSDEDFSTSANRTAHMAFYTRHNGTAEERLRITSGGNVGIGTVNPDQKLHVYNGAGDVTSFVEAVAGDALLKLSNTGNDNYSGIDFLRERSSGTGVPGGSIFMKSDTVDDKAHLYIQAQSASAVSGITNALTDNNGVRLKLHGADGIFSIETGSLERFRISSGGKVGIGTDNPETNLHLFAETGDCVLTLEADRGNSNSNENDNPYIVFRQDGSTQNSAIGMNPNGVTGENNSLVLVNGASSGGIRFKTGSGGNFTSGTSTKLFIASTGEVLINETTLRSYVDGAGYTQTPKLQVEVDDNTSSAIALRYNSAGGAANRRASFIFARTADGTAVSNNSVLGEVLFMGEGNSTLEKAASIRAEVDGTPGTNDMPGRLIFSTSADGSDSPIERLRITSGGNVGITTNDPQTLLHLKSDDPTLRIQRYNQSAYADITADTAGRITFKSDPGGNASDDGFSFTVDNSEKLRIMSSGSIGIRTTTGTNTVNIGGAAGLGVKFHNFTSGNSSYITVESGDKLQSNVGGSGYYTWVTGGSEKVRIANDGKVGINTTVPQSRLHVFQGKSGFGYGTTGQLIVENDGNSTIQLLSPNTHTSSVHFGDNDNGMVGRIIYDHTNNNLSFWNQNNQRMTIDSGKVGIGSTLPSKTLDVVGNDGLLIRTTSNGGASGTGGAVITMTDQTPVNDQAGFIKYRHTDAASPGDNYGSAFFVTSNTSTNAFVIGDFEHDNPEFNNDLFVKTNVGIGTHTISRGPLQIHSRSNNDVQIHMTNNETGVGSGNGFTIFGGAGTNGRDMGLVNRETTGAIEFYTSIGGTLAQRGSWHTGSDITTFCINTASNGTHSNFIVSNHDTTDYNGIANRSEYPMYSDIHFTGSDAISGGNRTKAAWRHDVENTITNNTSNTGGQRLQVYGIYSTLNSTKYSYIQYGAYLFANGSPDNSPRTQTVIGVYGYAQGYAASSSPDKSMNIYGGHFIGYRGGNTSGGHAFGLLGKAQQITNGSNKTGDLTGVYGEAECDDGPVTNAYAFRAHIDVDDETAGGNEKAEITNAYLYYGSYSIENTVGAAVTNKRGIWLTGCTDNYLAGDLDVAGNVTANGSKPFRIAHPLVGLSTTKDLIHTAIEGPQVDLIYRGKTTLVGGISTVNLDTKSGMTEGTFVALNRDVQCFTTNETGWTNVKGSVTGNQLTIIAQENTCTDTISWMVIGERQDDAIKASTLTDADGKLILEPDQKPVEEPIEHEEEKDINDPDGDINPAYE